MAAQTSAPSPLFRPSPLVAFALYAGLGAGALAMLLPFAWMVSTSLKTPGEVFAYPVVWLPQPPQWQNYAQVVEQVPIGRYYINSVFVAVSATLLELLTASAAAFAFARLRFPGRDAVFMLYLATLMIPGQVTLIPSFLLIRTLGWYDTYQALILPGAVSAFSTFLLRQYFRTVPLDLDEAARIDGASSFQIWLRVIMPLSVPALVTLAIFSFLGQWNSFLWPLIVTNSVELRTLPVGLAAFQGEFAVQWQLLMAATVIALAPVIVLYAVGQRWISEGLATTARG